MTYQQLKRIAWLWLAVVISLVMLLLFSCRTPEKMMSGLDKHPEKALEYSKKTLNNNTGEAAKFCNAKFPVFDVTNDSAFRESRRIIDSIARASQAAQEQMQWELTQLYRENEVLKYAIPTDCDTAVTRMQEIAKKEKARADKLEIDHRKLVAAAKEMAPIETIRKSTAEVIAAQDRLNDAIDDGLQLSRENEELRNQRDNTQAKYEKEVAKHKGTVAVPWWILVLIAGYLLASGVRGSLNPIKWFLK